jgi:hypothetical protein
MTLPILLGLLVLCALAGLALRRRLRRRAAPVGIASDSAARREWARHWPDDWVQAVHLAGGAALIDGRHGVGLLRMTGADTVAHHVAQMHPVTGGLRLEFADFAAPAITLPLPDDTATDWLLRWQARRD